MAVIAYVGLHGSGKTYSMARECLRRSRDGARIGSNFGFRGGPEDVHVTTWDDVLDFCRASLDLWRSAGIRSVLAIDELGALAPARGWAKFPPALTLIWLEARKMGLDVMYTSQSLDFVDKYAREVTGRVIRCHAWGKKRIADKEGPGILTHRPRFFLTVEYNGWEYGRARAANQGFNLRRFEPDVGAAYDTMYIVELAAHLLDAQVTEMRGQGPTSGPEPRSPDAELLAGALSLQAPPVKRARSARAPGR